MRITAMAIAGAFAFIPPAHADCSVRSGATRTHLIELYTSEGCSSCPPADRWLNALPSGAAPIALAFHVDYWDSPSWSDRFANPRFTERQQALAAHSNSTIVYTPEVAFDGREWRHWSATRPPARAATSAPALALQVTSGAQVEVTLNASLAAADKPDAYVAYIAISEDKLSSAVRGGENSGAQLHHDHVVRAFAGPLPLAQAHATMDLPGDVHRENAQVVAFVQRADSGEIANAVEVPLQQCAQRSTSPIGR